MTEQQARWSGFKYEPVGAITTKLLARYLRTQRKNMLRFFQERGLYTLADRMKQIRNSHQGMLAKNSMFQEVLNSYASQNMQAPYQAPKRVGEVHGVRADSFQGVATSEPGESEIQVDGVAAQKPRADARGSEQALRISDSDPIIAEDL